MFALTLCACALLLCCAQVRADCTTSLLGTNYMGTQNTTASGLTCQAWTSQSPQTHVVYNDADFPDGSAANASNYCRNPTSACGGPWCYTTNPAVPIASCGMTMCDCLDTPLGTDYTGTVNITASGRDCQAWTSQTPHIHPVWPDADFPDGSAAAAVNYCRNPDSNSEGPWCYTRDLDKVRDTCGIPACGNKCNTTPCVNGICTQVGNGYNCTCSPGYTGVNCNQQINNCASQPCQNNGTCMGSTTGYSCLCPPGYNGTNCQTIDINSCASAITGSAQLQATIAQLKQQLATCQNQQANQQTCTNNTVIINNNGTNQGPCTNTSCPNCGTCNQQGTGFTCTCAAGYSGTNCATPSVGGNVALKRPAYQSSTYSSDFLANQATDGNTNPLSGYHSCSSTQAIGGTNSWWYVDLGQVYCIGWLQITNRWDLGANLMQNFNVGVMNTIPTATLLPSQYSLCATYAGYPPAGTTTTIVCQPGTQAGQYVVIQIPSGQWLSLCEVQVYPAGTPQNIAVNLLATQSSDYSTWTAGLAVDGNTNPNAGLLSCSSTIPVTGVNSWWSLDLGKTTCVAWVQITTRVDCCPSNLANFNVGLMNTAPVVGQNVLPSQYSLCAYYPDWPQVGETVNLPCSTATVPGRYLIVQIPQSNYLTLCEVQVYPCSPLTPQAPVSKNLALKRPAFQSSDYPASPASLATDGNTNPWWGYTSCAMTNYVGGINSWWAVDLGQPTCVGQVMITNRYDCCPTRLANFIIGLTNIAPVPGNALNSNYSVCYQYIGNSIPAGASPTFTCTTQQTGRYLIVLLPITDYLTMCEVQVFGCSPRVNIALNQPTTQSSNYSNWYSNLGVDGNTNPIVGYMSCTGTNPVPGTNSWWSVDLGSTTCVSYVMITNRVDAPSWQSNFNVGLMNTPPSGQLMPSQYSLCGYYPDWPIGGETVTITCMPSSQPGRYLVVQIPEPQYFSVCEVQVFAC